MTENRLDKFTIEEIQVMYRSAQGVFTGQTQLKVADADALIVKFRDELTEDLMKRQKVIADEIERITPRCEHCGQRIEK